MLKHRAGRCTHGTCGTRGLQTSTRPVSSCRPPQTIVLAIDAQAQSWSKPTWSLRYSRPPKPPQGVSRQ
eukprot:4649386-Heterocapsa_arctica.AAC.1